MQFLWKFFDCYKATQTKKNWLDSRAKYDFKCQTWIVSNVLYIKRIFFFQYQTQCHLYLKSQKNIQNHRRQHFWISDSARKKHLNIIEKLKHFLTLLLWNVLNQVYTTYYSTCYLVVYNSFGWLVKAAAPLLCSESFELIIRTRSFFATKWIPKSKAT